MGERKSIGSPRPYMLSLMRRWLQLSFPRSPLVFCLNPTQHLSRSLSRLVEVVLSRVFLGSAPLDLFLTASHHWCMSEGAGPTSRHISVQRGGLRGAEKDKAAETAETAEREKGGKKNIAVRAWLNAVLTKAKKKEKKRPKKERRRRRTGRKMSVNLKRAEEISDRVF